MSLTNPNKIVTEERLSEFYGQILPYMGGMPDVLANKFSKGDLYSTDEKIVGQWTDGRPVYQKTISLGSTSAGRTDFSWSSWGITNVGVIWLVNGRMNHAQGWSYNCIANYESASDYFFMSAFQDLLRINSPFALSNGSATVRYTKTTDSPIAIGSDTDYSTDEKIVGTWTDGKPIYQKTFTGLSHYTGAGWQDFINITGMNVDKLIGAIGMWSGAGDYGFMDGTWHVNSTKTKVGLYFHTNLTVTMTGGTIQYTKNTD